MTKILTVLAVLAATLAPTVWMQADPEPTCAQSPVCQAALAEQQKALTDEFARVLRRQARQDLRRLANAVANCEARNR